MSLICTKCNTVNIDIAKFCKNCGSDIAELLKATYEEDNKDNFERKMDFEQSTESKIDKKKKIEKIDNEWIDDLKSGLKWGVLGSIIMWILLMGLINSSPQSEESFHSPIEEVKSSAPHNNNWYTTHTLLSMPITGIMERKLKKGNAPLEIKTSLSTGNYFLKINNIKTGKTIIKAFIRSGEILSTTLPTGEYEIKYANGENWYGEIDLFGPDTVYSKVSETFLFDGYNGYTVELIKQVGGNLQTESINANTF